NDAFRHAVTEAHSPADAVEPYWWPRGFRGRDRLNPLLYADVKTNLPDYLVTIEERMTMSASLEARNPMLDHRVVNFLMSLPAALKLRDGQNKWPLWKLCERYLPREVYDRPKRGFTPPLGMWLTQNADRLAAHFARHAVTLDRVFSLSWKGFLTTGRYDAASTMPVYYSLVLTKWAERYAEYIGDWPAAESSVSTRRHATFRGRTPAAVGEARWFAQALGNFAEGASVRVVGEDEVFFSRLAERLGYVVTDDAAAVCQVVVGAAAVRDTAWDNFPGGEVVLFVPFAASEQAGVQALMSSLPAGVTVRGGQGVQVDRDRGVMIARVAVSTELATRQVA
ncbi:MAG: asparagine synthase-related protein, partial [Planctomycetota bacterium]